MNSEHFQNIQSETAGFESSSELTFFSVPSLPDVCKACKLPRTENMDSEGWGWGLGGGGVHDIPPLTTVTLLFIPSRTLAFEFSRNGYISNTEFKETSYSLKLFFSFFRNWFHHSKLRRHPKVCGIKNYRYLFLAETPAHGSQHFARV